MSGIVLGIGDMEVNNADKVPLCVLFVAFLLLLLILSLSVVILLTLCLGVFLFGLILYRTLWALWT